jgi:regulator of RNase E activity RraA
MYRINPGGLVYGNRDRVVVVPKNAIEKLLLKLLKNIKERN